MAEMALENAQRNLDDAVMKAPFDGVIGNITIKAGDIVTANTIAIRLIDPQEINFTVSVNESDIFKVKIGSQASVQIDALSSIQIPATVSAIGASAIASGGIASYPVQLQATSRDTDSINSHQIPDLKEGLTVTVTIITAEKNNVIVIPLNTLFREGGTTCVEVIKPNGSAEKRTVQTGLSTWQYIEITGGLSEGEQIVLP